MTDTTTTTQRYRVTYYSVHGKIDIAYVVTATDEDHAMALADEIALSDGYSQVISEKDYITTAYLAA